MSKRKCKGIYEKIEWLYIYIYILYREKPMLAYNLTQAFGNLYNIIVKVLIKVKLDGV